VKRPGVARYLAVVAAFGLGLMSKPMIVTLPFVLLLLDVWPLGAPRGRGIWPRRKPAFEKLPLFALAAGDSALTLLAQRQGGAVAPLAGIPLAFRLENALVSYVAYIRDMFWPAGLAVLYPYPRTLPIAEVAAAGLALAGISVVVARQFRKRPYLAVGWCWYLGTLAPVIGLVQVGTQARADRYTYVPMVGLFLMLAWGAAELVERLPRARYAVVAAAVLACAACLAVTWSQIQHWATSETLLRHTLEVTSDNFITHHNLADYYLQQNRNEEAYQEDAEAVRINPVYLEARLNLALALSLTGKPAEAETEYRKALELHPEGKLLYVGHSGLGAVLAAQHRTGEALPELQLASQLKPDSAESHYNLGTALQELGRNQEAAPEFAAVVRLGPTTARRGEGWQWLWRPKGSRTKRSTSSPWWRNCGRAMPSSNTIWPSRSPARDASTRRSSIFRKLSASGPTSQPRAMACKSRRPSARRRSVEARYGTATVWI
jgi:tetratricopeptide (TPR) repeat protein